MNHGTGATFHQRSTWAQLLFAVGPLVAALIVVTYAPTNPGLAATAFAVATVLVIILQIVSHTVLAGVTRDEPDDERDAAIHQRADRWAGFVLTAAVVLAVNALYIQRIGVTQSGTVPVAWQDPIFVAHCLVAAFLLSEVVRLGGTLFLYRHGHG